MRQYHDCPDAPVSGGKGYCFYHRCDIDAKFAPDLTIAFGVDAERIRAHDALAEKRQARDAADAAKRLIREELDHRRNQ